MAWDGCRFDSHGHARGRPSNKYHTYSIPFTRIEYGYVRVSIRETRRRHQINLHRDAPHSFVHSRVRPSSSPSSRSVGRHIDARTNERTNERTNDDDDGSLLRAHLFHGRVRLSTRLDSTRLDRTRVIIESSIARPHRSYRARSYLGRAIDDGTRGMTRAWGRCERSRDARDDEGTCARTRD